MKNGRIGTDKSHLKTKEEISDAIHNSDITAGRDTDKYVAPSYVTSPTLEEVVNAKEWVDNGSRL